MRSLNAISKKKVAEDNGEMPVGINPAPETADAATVVLPFNGGCPEGFSLSADGTKCLKNPESGSANVPPTTVTGAETSVPMEQAIAIEHVSTNFVFGQKTILQTEDEHKKVQFDEGEEIEVCMDENEDIQIGQKGTVLVISDPKVAYNFLEQVHLKSDCSIEEQALTIVDAVKSNLSPRQIAEELLKQHSKEGSLSHLEVAKEEIRLKVNRGVKRIRPVENKAPFIRQHKANKSFAPSVMKIVGVL
jgi:hypothetical protein